MSCRIGGLRDAGLRGGLREFIRRIGGGGLRLGGLRESLRGGDRANRRGGLLQPSRRGDIDLDPRLGGGLREPRRHGGEPPRRGGSGDLEPRLRGGGEREPRRIGGGDLDPRRGGGEPRLSGGSGLREPRRIGGGVREPRRGGDRELRRNGGGDLEPRRNGGGDLRPGGPRPRGDGERVRPRNGERRIGLRPRGGERRPGGEPSRPPSRPLRLEGGRRPGGLLPPLGGERRGDLERRRGGGDRELNRRPGGDLESRPRLRLPGRGEGERRRGEGERRRGEGERRRRGGLLRGGEPLSWEFWLLNCFRTAGGPPPKPAAPRGGLLARLGGDRERRRGGLLERPKPGERERPRRGERLGEPSGDFDRRGDFPRNGLFECLESQLLLRLDLSLVLNNLEPDLTRSSRSSSLCTVFISNGFDGSGGGLSSFFLGVSTASSVAFLNLLPNSLASSFFSSPPPSFLLSAGSALKLFLTPLGGGVLSCAEPARLKRCVCGCQPPKPVVRPRGPLKLSRLLRRRGDLESRRSCLLATRSGE